MADIAEKPDFEELCIKCEQMELDVSIVEIYFFQNCKISSNYFDIPIFCEFWTTVTSILRLSYLPNL